MKMKAAPVLLACVALMTTTPSMKSDSDPNASFRALADHYFSDVMFRFGPSNATLTGFHQYDSKLEDYSRSEFEAEVAALKDYEKKFDAFPADRPG